METADYPNITWQTLANRRGVTLRVNGEGPPLLVFPGMEGSGESCLHLAAPVTEEAAARGKPHRLILVDYAAEKHATLADLCHTITEAVEESVGGEAVIWGQSFGNLLAATVAQEARLQVNKLVLVSPFTGLPPLRTRLGVLVLQFTPTLLYRQTTKPAGRFLFGPAGDQPNHPFFDALQRGRPQVIARRTNWLQGHTFEDRFRNLRAPARVWLGAEDRLVDLDNQKDFFSGLTQDRTNYHLSVIEGAGHVVLDTDTTRQVRRKLLDWLLADV